MKELIALVVRAVFASIVVNQVIYLGTFDDTNRRKATRVDIREERKK